MKTFKRLIATFFTGILSWPYMLMAQDEGTYIDDLGGQDSSYMEQDLLAESAQSSGSSFTTIIIIVLVVIVLAAIYFFLKRKKMK